MRARRRFAVAAETSDERIRIRVGCIALTGGEVAVVATEVEGPSPVPSRGLAVADAFKINSRFVGVIVAIEGEVI